MGMLNVTFDDKFDVLSWAGNPILLDNSIPQGMIWLLKTGLKSYEHINIEIPNHFRTPKSYTS